MVAATLLLGCGRIDFEVLERDGGGDRDAVAFDARAADATGIDAAGLDASVDGGAARDAGPHVDAPAIDAGPVPAPRLVRVITAASAGAQVPAGIAVDRAGNVIIAGYTELGLDFGVPHAGAGGQDGFVASFAPDGTHRWSRVIGGSTLDEQAWYVAVDSMDNVFVAGRFYATVDFGGGPVTSAGERDAYVASYTADGTYRWVRTWGNATDDTAFGLFADGANDVYVTGWFYGAFDMGTGTLTAADGQDVLAASLTNDGTTRFARSFGAVGVDQGQKIAVDASGRAVVVGLFSESIDLGEGVVSSAGARDGFILALDGAGARRWSRTLGGAGGDEAVGVAIDPAGNVYVVGPFAETVDFGTGEVTSAGSSDGYVASYTADGTPRWVEPMGGTGLQHLARAAWSPRGYVVAAGWFNDPFDSDGVTISSRGGQDGVLVAHDAGGRRLWTFHLGSEASESIRGVAVGGDHTVYAAGLFSGTADYGMGPMTSDMADFYVAVLRQD